MSINLSGGYTDYVSSGPGEAPRSERPASGPVSGNFQYMSGGVVRYSMAPDDPGAVVETVRQPAIRPDVNTVYRSGPDGTTASPAHSRYTANESVGGATGILATARNAFGNLTSVDEIKPTTLIRYGQSETQAQVLERMGVLGRDANGRYYEIGGGGNVQSHYQQPQQQSNVVDDTFTREAFPGEVETTYEAAIAPIPEQVYMSAMAKSLEGDLQERDIREVARLSNLPVEDIQQRIQFVERAFGVQADHVARTQGVNDPAELWEWAATQKPEAYARARQELVFGRNTAPLRALAQQFFRDNPPSLEALRQSGYEVSKTQAGHDVVKVKGRWMSPASAAKLGWL